MKAGQVIVTKLKKKAINWQGSHGEVNDVTNWSLALWDEVMWTPKGKPMPQIQMNADEINYMMMNVIPIVASLEMFEIIDFHPYISEVAWQLQ